uniref:BHLH domain-containing protein n=1 Tax=Kalanchoe fedtschenkoi TaxID=63787 RepID=A0A7N0T7R0_KALFE
MSKERERRGHMARMYSILHSFLPNLSSDNQASREKIVAETIHLIKRLEDSKSRLEKAKAGLAAKSVASSSSSVALSASDDVAVFHVKRPHNDRTTLTTARILEVFDEHSADVLAASVVVDEGTVTVSVTAAVVSGDRSQAVERIKRDLLLP